MANPSMFPLPNTVQYLPVFVYSLENFLISNCIKLSLPFFSISTFERLLIVFCLSDTVELIICLCVDVPQRATEQCVVLETQRLAEQELSGCPPSRPDCSGSNTTHHNHLTCTPVPMTMSGLSYYSHHVTCTPVPMTEWFVLLLPSCHLYTCTNDYEWFVLLLPIR